MKTVAILHGWAGGSWHTTRFVEALKNSGFRIIKNPRESDIIFAHSTGSYRLPENSQAKLVIIVGPPYWPSQSMLRRLLKKKTHDSRHLINNRGYLFTLKKTFFEILYVLVKPVYTIIALKNHRYLHFLELIKNKKSILIRNEDDYFCSPEIEVATNKYKSVNYITLPGGHDDFMTNPQPYIDLLLKEL